MQSTCIAAVVGVCPPTTSFESLVNKHQRWLNLFPSRNILFPHGNNFFPHGKLSFPHGKISFPDGKLSFPYGKVLFPPGNFLFPNANKLFPNGKITQLVLLCRRAFALRTRMQRLFVSNKFIIFHSSGRYLFSS